MIHRVVRKHTYFLIFVSFALMFFSSSVKNVFQVWFVDISRSFGVTHSEVIWRNIHDDHWGWLLACWAVE